MPPLQDEALSVIPVAVIEVINPGYEFKDVYLNPQFYLAQDVDDVVVVDPRSGVVTHYRTTGVAIHQAPVTLQLQCGCQCTVPAVEVKG
jgi:Uma2 family endonuclease